MCDDQQVNGGTPTWEGMLAVCASGVAGGVFAVAAAGGSDGVAAWLWPLLPVVVTIGEARRGRRRAR